MLVLGLMATMSANVVINGAAFLIPALHLDLGLHLAQAGLLVAMPNLGVAVTIIGWGYLVDLVGERVVLAAGLGLTAAVTFAAALADSLVAVGVFLFMAGMAAASNTAASGRLVVGWFPPERRGVAMGIRHTASPLGVALGALVIPQLAQHHGVGAALLFPAVLCAVCAVACALGVLDPPRPPRAEAPAHHLVNPYRGSTVLWRIHAASMLLVVPQSVVWTFTLVWLMADRRWSAASAGVVVVVAQLLGALGRVAAGHWSDHIGARLRPIRTIAVAAALAMLVLGLTDHLGSSVSVAVVVIASVITVTDNGLAYVAIAERAGPYWSGRALGVQYTGQTLTTASIPPIFGALIAVAGYPLAFAASAVFALAAPPVVPVHADQPQSG
ncbi:MFS transporter [Mycolicibacterium sp. S2-37]|uniref:MFS transporter n=1 Tax=Mycolicibacterium sp. S2-37 TaxID=2810297 RepID=UPI001A949736|nr:MFS transporter [Mycolicibacterium sp. S2-37]MBO0681036.1 MFS transporter [Mycolicibacterium sp. S2-37]